MPIPQYIRDLRAKVGNMLIMTVGVAAITFNDEGHVLLIRRADSGRWSLPGGMLEPGEVPADALLREVREETGVTAMPERVLGVFGGPDFRREHANGDVTSNTGAIFVCRWVSGVPRPDGDETTDACFVPLEEAIQRMAYMPMSKQLFLAAQAGGEAALFAPPTWAPAPDAVRENGMSSYMRAMRAIVGNDVIMTLGCGAIIRNAHGEVLMQHRGDTGDWGFVGGGADPDESPADVVVREAWEETGMLVRPTRLIGLYGGPAFTFTYPNGHQLALVSMIFDCEVLEGTPVPDGEESLALKYYSAEEALALPMVERNKYRLEHALANDSRAYFDPPLAAAE